MTILVILVVVATSILVILVVILVVIAMTILVIHAMTILIATVNGNPCCPRRRRQHDMLGLASSAQLRLSSSTRRPPSLERDTP